MFGAHVCHLSRRTFMLVLCCAISNSSVCLQITVVSVNASPIRNWFITFLHTQSSWVVASNLSNSIRLIRPALHSIDAVLPGESGGGASARSWLTTWYRSNESCPNPTVEEKGDGWVALKGSITLISLRFFYCTQKFHSAETSLLANRKYWRARIEVPTNFVVELFRLPVQMIWVLSG